MLRLRAGLEAYLMDDDTVSPAAVGEVLTTSLVLRPVRALREASPERDDAVEPIVGPDHGELTHEVTGTLMVVEVGRNGVFGVVQSRGVLFHFAAEPSPPPAPSAGERVTLVGDVEIDPYDWWTGPWGPELDGDSAWVIRRAELIDAPMRPVGNNSFRPDLNAATRSDVDALVPHVGGICSRSYILQLERQGS